MVERWEVLYHKEFREEFLLLDEAVQDEISALVKSLSKFGPKLSRPQADTLSGSKHANMKELRFKVNKGVWRTAFAFDPKRRAILLVAGNKAGMSQRLFYKRLMKIADQRFDQWLDMLQEEM